MADSGHAEQINRFSNVFTEAAPIVELNAFQGNGSFDPNELYLWKRG